MDSVILALVVWAAGTFVAVQISRSPGHDTLPARIAVPVVFGIMLLVMWELLVKGLNVSQVILPAPSVIAATFARSTPTLWGDFLQTALKGGVSGYLIGCSAAFVAALAIDRVPFLQRGLLPIGNFVAALPIVGIAPDLYGDIELPRVALLKPAEASAPLHRAAGFDSGAAKTTAVVWQVSPGTQTSNNERVVLRVLQAPSGVLATNGN